MKNLSFALAFLFSISYFDSSAQKVVQRAAKGDTVWVIVNHIKADKKAQFEKFITETFWGASNKLKGNDKTVFKQTRVLYPTQPETDGTLSYIFIMDPVLSGGDYDIYNLLTKIYGDQKASEYNNVFNETAASEQTMYIEIQSEN
jgi:hypothetical protein